MSLIEATRDFSEAATAADARVVRGPDITTADSAAPLGTPRPRPRARPPVIAQSVR